MERNSVATTRYPQRIAFYSSVTSQKVLRASALTVTTLGATTLVVVAEAATEYGLAENETRGDIARHVHPREAKIGSACPRAIYRRRQSRPAELEPTNRIEDSSLVLHVQPPLRGSKGAVVNEHRADQFYDRFLRVIVARSL